MHTYDPVSSNVVVNSKVELFRFAFPKSQRTQITREFLWQQGRLSASRHGISASKSLTKSNCLKALRFVSIAKILSGDKMAKS